MRFGWLCALVAFATPGSAQSAGTTVMAVVGDAVTGLFLHDAEVSIRGRAGSVHTDSMARATFPRVPAGVYTIEVRRLGYAPLSAPIKVSGSDSMEVVLLMRASAQELPAVDVTEPMAPLGLREFDERLRHHTGGYFITDSSLRAARDHDLPTVLATCIPGILVSRSTSPPYQPMIRSTRGPTSLPGASKMNKSCSIAIYIDGVLNGELDSVAYDEIGGIEYYSTGFIPPMYKRPGAGTCGVMLLWRR